jgi:LysM repeat protein
MREDTMALLRDTDCREGAEKLMILAPMRYGDYVWPHNPRVYEIEYNRRIVCHKVPFGLYTLSDMGRDQRILRGEGEFTGEGAYQEFKKLACMFYLSEPQVLVHPVWQSAKAWFVGLRLKQEPKEDYVSYEFEFWECFDGYELSVKTKPPTKESQDETAKAPKSTYTVKRGDTMWAIAVNNGLSLAELIALNPQIKNPNLIYVGDIIYLS